MMETSPIKAHADRQLGSGHSFDFDAPSLNGHGAGGDEDSTIKCICGYNDDDGNTVFCELCSTWQHIECYYPSTDVPEIHECVDCRPRQVDAKAATERQRQSRVAVSSGERKAKRGPTKSHRKKARDVGTSLQINGSTAAGTTAGAADQALGFDRASGSPRDQPPTKRPKTSHRASSSTTSISHPLAVVSASRKRAGSAAVAVRSPTKSPSTPMVNGYSGEHFSPEFMRLYTTEFTPTKTNSFSNLSVSLDLSTWLDDVDQLLEVTKGKKQHDVFQRWDKPWEELEDISPGVTKTTIEDSSIRVHGKHPQFQWLTADSDAAAGAFIGEINGQIGRIDDYCQDPANRWESLRHPEPFVFFHDKLPICIDCRQEGSELRYVRRSCQPNARMQVIIVGKEYHFCLVSTEPILQGREITIGWNIDEKPQALMKTLIDKGGIRPEEEAYMASWISGVLANFGGCPCGRREGVCFFERFRSRGSQLADPPSNALGPKPTSRSRKGKKGPNQVSPLSTGRATNSRASSEAVNQVNIDDYNADGRSTTGSSRSKPSSRDITPLAHFTDASVGLGVELSSREQRKLMQQERLFEQMENDGSRRRKRNSAGSALNTPSVTTSKQLGFADPIDPSPTSAFSTGKARINGQSMHGANSRSGRPSTNGRPDHARGLTPSYSEISTQTDPPGSVTSSPSALTSLRRVRGCSFATKLLRQARKHKVRADAQASGMVNGNSDVSPPIPARSDSTSIMEQAMDTMAPPLVHRQETLPNMTGVPTFTPAVTSSTSNMAAQADVDMKDVEKAVPEPPLSIPDAKETKKPTSIDKVDEPMKSSDPHHNSHPLTQPQPSPWPDASSSEAYVHPTITLKSPTPSKPPLHVELPAAPNFPNQPLNHTQTPTTPYLSSSTVLDVTAITNATSVTTPGGLPASPFAQSPTAMAGNTPMFSPSVTGAVSIASPMKKKLSLSDYTSRKKKIEAAQQAAHAKESSPLTNSTNSATGEALGIDATIKEEMPNSALESSAISESIPPVGNSTATLAAAASEVPSAVDVSSVSLAEHGMDIDGSATKVEVPTAKSTTTGVGGW